jgi:hypothetical protein
VKQGSPVGLEKREVRMDAHRERHQGGRDWLGNPVLSKLNPVGAYHAEMALTVFDVEDPGLGADWYAALILILERRRPRRPDETSETGLPDSLPPWGREAA